MIEERAFKKTKYMLQSSIILENKNLLKVLIAINASNNKKMIKEDIEKITGLNSKDVSNSINILEKSNYIETFMEDIPNRSPHKICVLTEEGKEIIKSLGIEDKEKAASV